MTMKIKFDSDQQYQLDAISAVTDLFDGQPVRQEQPGLRFGNYLELSDDGLLTNLQAVQRRNEIEPVATKLDGMDFSIEMETGTGKTYVYLRTIYELNVRYGFTKFIIVVPSVAIREGVVKNLQITEDHLRNLYGNIPLDYYVYDSKRVSVVRQFATSNHLQVMVINIDAFNKRDNNVIHRENDRLSGLRPIQFIQATNPIVILDEPQNMEGEPAKQAIASLNPLCTLRYSATHRNRYNLLYRLDPVQAYELNLVKQIEVDGVLDADDLNQPYLQVKAIRATKTQISAELIMDVATKNGLSRKSVRVNRSGIDLFETSGKRAAYQGYIVDEIDAGNQVISFTNGVRLSVGQTQGDHKDDVMAVQIRETVKEHLEKELRFQERLPEGRRLKVLSLFFIDRVANYYDEDGKIRRWFEEAYEELASQPRYRVLNLPPAAEVHSGYFAQSRGTPRDTRGNTLADNEAYELIMRDKERLLSLSEPVRFIFSHSALREGWDNPNVFQICTLNETRSEVKKRQEIGRGLRLPVDETGQRVFDPSINRLTVVANESYDQFARALQTEMTEDCGVVFRSDLVNNKRERRKISLKKGWQLNQEFLELWERIKHRTQYSVRFDTGELITRASRALKKMPSIQPPKIRVEKGSIEVTTDQVTYGLLAHREVNISYNVHRVPDLLSYLQQATELTRSTIAEVLIQSDRLSEVAVNPQQFLDQALEALKTALDELKVAGVTYEKIDGEAWEMRLFEDEEIESYLTRVLEVQKSIYDALEFDSDTEAEFARKLDEREDVLLFFKLPRWFEIDTPVGEYRPDWAIVKREDEKLYLIRETKGTKKLRQLRIDEGDKARCGAEHFKTLNVDFEIVTRAEEI